MTQTLDLDERSSRLAARAAAAPASGSTAANASKFETFAITFGIALVILYTICERWNWPLFTYHPAIDRWDFLRQPGQPEDGPPMFWYGWVVLSGMGAFVVGLLATRVSVGWLQRATVFCCVLAALWPICFALAGVIDERASFNAEFLRSVWVDGIPALAGAAAVSSLVSAQWARRLWTGWLLIMPIGGLAILGYSLNTYFTR
jgi:hypothetical protein